MTDRLRAAAQAALEAVETVLCDAFERRFPECCGHPQGNECCGNWNEAQTPTDNRIMDILSPVQRQLSEALRAALAEPEAASEPFVWYDDDTGETWTPGAVQDGGAPDGLRPLYAAPIKQDVPATDFGNMEPVAWYLPSDEGCDSMFRDHRTVVTCTGNPWTGWQPLYTAPPSALADPEVGQEPADDVWFEDRNGACRKSPRDCQRFGANGVPEAVWVNGKRYGLTDEEALRAISPDLYHHIEGAERETRLADARAIEAALKERNE